MSQESARKKIVKEKRKQTGSLDLSFEFLFKVPEEIIELKHLHSLNLTNNHLSDYSFLENLVHLQTLNLGSNQISDYSFLANLHNLTTLDLRSNEISDISFLANLHNLTTLYLSYNEVLDISFLANLHNLTTLDLSYNEISDISFLVNLHNLTTLDLRSNEISDISFLANLSNLTSLDLSDNQIKILPRWVVDFSLDIVCNYVLVNNAIDIGGNPLEYPPIEIVEKGRNAIVKYFDDIEKQGKDYLYEAKLLIVGDGGAGKTSLAWKMKKLDSEMPKEGEDRTKGIEIKAMSIHNIHQTKQSFLMNVWDFGGQGYYHSTHQFFLTKRSLYVLLNNTRINKTDFNDWLQTIALFSDNSPVILVENEVGGAKSELDEKGLKSFFGNILYKRIANIANITDGRLEQLISDIKIEIQRLPHIGSELPKQWVEIRKSLKTVAETQAYISDRAFYEICKQHRISEKEARQRLGDLFHDLGIFLHFRDDKVLKRIVILQNAWATKGVYTILDNDVVRSQNGYFTIEQAENIWNNTDYEDLHDELVSLMEKFKLCYRIPYSTPTAYISPNLLPVEQPDYTWDKHQNLVIYYDYDFMPKGLLGMLIVELHRYVKDIKNLAWRNGCVFHHQNTDAQVIETYGKKKLEIRIKGIHCVHLSSIIISEIDKLNDSFKRIKVKKLIPCPCSDCKKSDTPEFYEYKDLMRRKSRNKLTIECSYSYDDIKVLEILEASYNENYVGTLSLKQLIQEGKIKEAIDAFEQEFPREGTLLLSKFNQLERYYYLGMIDSKEWFVNKQQITNSLLYLSEQPSRKATIVITSKNIELKQLDKKLEVIEKQLEGQNMLLNNIMDKSHVYQHELIGLLRMIESKENRISEDFAAEIVATIEKGMADFVQKVPNETTIIAEWQKASHQLKLMPDSKAKAKLKWTVPFLFIELEKEISWDGKAWFNEIKGDIKRGIKGNWKEMFVKEY
ncbi:MAG: COR domain-containing protein [Chitinophagales bacterium]